MEGGDSQASVRLARSRRLRYVVGSFAVAVSILLTIGFLHYWWSPTADEFAILWADESMERHRFGRTTQIPGYQEFIATHDAQTLIARDGRVFFVRPGSIAELDACDGSIRERIVSDDVAVPSLLVPPYGILTGGKEATTYYDLPRGEAVRIEYGSSLNRCERLFSAAYSQPTSRLAVACLTQEMNRSVLVLGSGAIIELPGDEVVGWTSDDRLITHDGSQHLTIWSSDLARREQTLTAHASSLSPSGDLLYLCRSSSSGGFEEGVVISLADPEGQAHPLRQIGDQRISPGSIALENAIWSHDQARLLFHGTQLAESLRGMRVTFEVWSYDRTTDEIRRVYRRRNLPQFDHVSAVAAVELFDCTE